MKMLRNGNPAGENPVAVPGVKNPGNAKGSVIQRAFPFDLAGAAVNWGPAAGKGPHFYFMPICLAFPISFPR
jgi:hypothetical protein